MLKKISCLSEQALSVLKMPEVKLRLMLFFEVSDARTIDAYIKDNHPAGPLMNILVRDLILEYAPYLKDKIYRRLTQEEADALNKTKNELKKKHGESSQNN